MNKKIQYILVVFVLFLGFQVQAQNTITAYEIKLSSLSTTEAEKLDYLANGAPSSMFVTRDNEAKINRSTNITTIVEMTLVKPSDFTKLVNAFENNLAEIEIINIEWDGQEDWAISNVILQKMEHLKYIYIRSYQPLNASIIQSRLQNLMNALEEKANVEVLFYTMKQPS